MNPSFCYNASQGADMAYVLTSNRLKNGDVTYYIYDVSRIPNSGKRKMIIVSRWKESEILARNLDPKAYASGQLARLRGEKAAASESGSVAYKVDFSLTNRPETAGGALPEPVNSSKCIGYAPYSWLFHRLELDEFLNCRRRRLGFRANLNVIIQNLVYSRCLFPGSKLKAWENRDMFFGDTSYSLQDVYRSLDPLLEWREPLLKHLDAMIQRSFKRMGTTIYYDVTNYYFERDEEDEMRKRGVSKEHRPEPIIQMGLFMDENGLPITYELFEGNRTDVSTFGEAMEKSIIDFRSSRRIIVADKGMMSYKNILAIRSQENGYVISQSVRRADAGTKEFTLESEGYEPVTSGDGALLYMIKERTVPRAASAESDVDGQRHSGQFNERQVFIYSPKYAERARSERAQAIEKARKYAGTKSKDSRDSTYGKLKYVKKTPMAGGKESEADCYMVELDEARILEDEKYDGYYIICTNVVGTDSARPGEKEADPYYRKDGFLVLGRPVSARDIQEMYGGLWRIEETFKVTKTGMLNLRPVFHSKTDRIKAHFLLCFLALTLERLLESELKWEHSAKSIQNSLRRLSGPMLPDSNIYLFTYYDEVIRDIEEVTGLNLSRKFMTQLDVRKLLGESKKKDYET